MAISYLGVGSNLGNRRKNIILAAAKVNSLSSTRVIKLSRFIRTSPQGGPKMQPDYLNACLKISTALGPLKLLKNLKAIEKDLRRAKNARNGPRTIDLDILLYGDKTLKSKYLNIPHPRMFERDFVLTPLLEVLCA